VRYPELMGVSLRAMTQLRLGDQDAAAPNKRRAVLPGPFQTTAPSTKLAAFAKCDRRRGARYPRPDTGHRGGADRLRWAGAQLGFRGRPNWPGALSEKPTRGSAAPSTFDDAAGRREFSIAGGFFLPRASRCGGNPATRSWPRDSSEASGLHERGRPGQGRRA